MTVAEVNCPCSCELSVHCPVHTVLCPHHLPRRPLPRPGTRTSLRISLCPLFPRSFPERKPGRVSWVETAFRALTACRGQEGRGGNGGSFAKSVSVLFPTRPPSLSVADRGGHARSRLTWTPGLDVLDECSGGEVAFSALLPDPLSGTPCWKHTQVTGASHSCAHTCALVHDHASHTLMSPRLNALPFSGAPPTWPVCPSLVLFLSEPIWSILTLR